MMFTTMMKKDRNDWNWIIHTGMTGMIWSSIIHTVMIKMFGNSILFKTTTELIGNCILHKGMIKMIEKMMNCILAPFLANWGERLLAAT